jgi:hypothetical protein
MLLGFQAGHPIWCVHLEDDNLEEVHLGLVLLLPQFFALHYSLSSGGNFEADVLTNEIPNA